MYTHPLQRNRVGVLAARSSTAGVLVASALIFPACGGTEFDSSELDTAVVSFSILANAAVTCTSGSVIDNVGTNLAAPDGSVTLTSCPVTGTVHVGDAVAKRAFNRFLVKYAALAPSEGKACTVLTGTLAGRTLPPGTYCFDAAAALTGVLTLAGPPTGMWTFKIGTSGTGTLTSTNFSIVMADGGQACNVTWWVSQAATTMTSTFKGNILAGGAITVTGGTLNGNAWAKADMTNTGTVLTGCSK